MCEQHETFRVKNIILHNSWAREEGSRWVSSLFINAQARTWLPFSHFSIYFPVIFPQFCSNSHYIFIFCYNFCLRASHKKCLRAQQTQKVKTFTLHFSKKKGGRNPLRFYIVVLASLSMYGWQGKWTLKQIIIKGSTFMLHHAPPWLLHISNYVKNFSMLHTPRKPPFGPFAYSTHPTSGKL